MAKKEGRIIHKFLVLFYIIALVTSGMLIYSLFLFQGVESLIRYIIMGLLACYDLFLLWRVLRIVRRKTRKKPHKILFLIWLLLYAGICFGGYYVLNYFYSKVSNVNKTDVTYTSSGF